MIRLKARLSQVLSRLAKAWAQPAAKGAGETENFRSRIARDPFAPGATSNLRLPPSFSAAEPAPKPEPKIRDLRRLADRPESSDRQAVDPANSARHIIICVDDAFPVGTIQRLEEASPSQCFSVISDALDAGFGSGHLKLRSIRAGLELALREDPRGRVIAYHIASTHAHILVREDRAFSPGVEVARWKNEALADVTARRRLDRHFWALGYYDQRLTDPGEIEAARLAILNHPQV